LGVPVGQLDPIRDEGGGGKTRRREVPMAVITMKALLETGVHFGHRTRKWNPRMKRYIFTERNGIHIIDLQQTLEALEIAYALIRDTAEAGGNVLFVGTKRQSQESIQLEAERCGMPYVNSRWLGGTLTNWRTIRSRISELENLEQRRDEGEFELLTKKEALTMTRKINRLEERLGGIRNMKGLPQLVFVVDVRREETAIHEANLLKIPVVALVDTNCDPVGVDYVIPSNDDAIRAIKLLTGKVADAILEGRALRKDVEEELLVASGEAVEVEEVERSDEELLGEATLAKLQTGEYDEKLRGVVEKEGVTEEKPEAVEEPEEVAEATAEAGAEEIESEGEKVNDVPVPSESVEEPTPEIEDEDADAGDEVAETEDEDDEVAETEDEGDEVAETEDEGDEAAETEDEGDEVDQTDDDGDEKDQTDDEGDEVDQTEDEGDEVDQTEDEGDEVDQTDDEADEVDETDDDGDEE
jgi:small subunit ribosomal protein S2